MRGGKTPKDKPLRELMGRRLRAARFAYNPNAAEVARSLSVPAQVLNSYEQGARYPNELFLVRFCDLVDCPVDWIFTGKMHVVMPKQIAAQMALRAPETVAAYNEDAFNDAVLRRRMGERLRLARTAYDPDTTAFAENLGVTSKVISAYETGRNYPDESFLIRFYEVTGVPIDWVFRGQMIARMSEAMSARIGWSDEGLMEADDSGDAGGGGGSTGMLAAAP